MCPENVYILYLLNTIYHTSTHPIDIRRFHPYKPNYGQTSQSPDASCLNLFLDINKERVYFRFQLSGHPLRSVLLALREMDGGMYKQLQGDFQRYAGCIGIVDTGYFKRSAASESPSKQTLSNNKDHVSGSDIFETWIKRYMRI